MFSFWLQGMLERLRSRRDRLLFRWHTSDKGHFGFGAMMLVPVTALGFLVQFARSDHIERQAAGMRQRDLRCLAENVYHEARGEPLRGQHAVAEVTLNRVASDEFPATVCEVVFEQRLDVQRRRYVGAFSWTELDRLRRPHGDAWQLALEVATAAYDGQEPGVVPDALYYHADAIEPRWAGEKQVVATIGNHIFYR